MIASISAGLFRSAIRRKCWATWTIADRSKASSLGAGWADFSSAISANGRVAGDVRSAGEPGTKESPVTTPHAPRLTSAVACCHRGLGAGRNWYTSYGWAGLMLATRGFGPLSGQLRGIQRPEDGTDPLVTGVVRVPEEHRGVLGRARRRADHPLPEDVRHEIALPGLAADRFRALGRVAGARRDGAGAGVPG